MLCTLCCVLCMFRVDAAAPLVFDFESEDAAASWTVTGPNASAKVTTAKELVLDGQGTLACTYTGQPGAPFSLTTTGLDVTGATSLSLRLKAATLSPLVLTLTEDDGSAYHTFVTCLPNDRCDINMPLTDFQLQENSSDENDTLDAAQIRSFTIQELANLGGQWSAVFGSKTGDQLLLVDDLTFGPENLPSRTKVEKDKTVIDSFDRPWLALLPLGGAQITRLPAETTQTASGLRVRFNFHPTGPEAWPGLVLPVGHIDLAGAKVLRLRLRAPGGLRVHVVLEEQDGSRYETKVSIVEASDWRARDVDFRDFALEAGGTDENAALDLDQVRVLIIVADAWNALLDETERGEFDLAEVLVLR